MERAHQASLRDSSHGSTVTPATAVRLGSESGHIVCLGSACTILGMPPNTYAWLATLALIAARNLKTNKHQDPDPDQGGRVVTHITAIAGLLACRDGHAANEPGLFLLVLCQISRETVQSVTGIAISCQIAARAAEARNPSPGAASRAPLVILSLCQIDHPPTTGTVWALSGHKLRSEPEKR